VTLKGEKYAMVFYQNDQGRMLWLGEGSEEEHIDSRGTWEEGCTTTAERNQKLGTEPLVERGFEYQYIVYLTLHSPCASSWDASRHAQTTCVSLVEPAPPDLGLHSPSPRSQPHSSPAKWNFS
jgi:hypothetical protein